MQPKKYFRSFRNTFQFKPKYFLLFLPLVLIVIINYCFKISKVDCFLNNQSCPDQIFTKVKQLEGKNFLLINQNRLVADLNQIEPVGKESISLTPFGRLLVKLKNNQEFLGTQLYYLQELPSLSMNQALVSSESSYFRKPVEEITQFLINHDSSSHRLWSNGDLTPMATTESKIKILSNNNLDQDFLSKLFFMFKLISQYLNYEALYALNNQIFLSRTGQPDIIILVPTDEVTLKRVFSSLNYLTSIKQDAKILDFRFRNPVVR